jgi:hypothetical protein
MGYPFELFNSGSSRFTVEFRREPLQAVAIWCALVSQLVRHAVGYGPASRSASGAPISAPAYALYLAHSSADPHIPRKRKASEEALPLLIASWC